MEFTLTTRKIVFGMLLVLVLAFSMQGIADAQAPVVDVPPSVTGTTSSMTTLTVTAPATATVTAGRLGDTFPVFSQSGTTYTSTLTLPNAVGNYALTVFVNNTAYPVSVIVFADTGGTGSSLTVRVDPFDGAPGSKATVTFTAIGADNQPAFITVNLRATGGTLSRSSELTGTSGSGTGTVTLTRGNTPGNENYVTASVPGYTTARARFLISGMPVVAAAADFAIYSGNNQRGSLNVPLAEPFSVAVVDAHGDPIEDVRVRFRVRQGRGTFSPRIPRTDAEGRAETIFTPTSAGRIRVEATVGGVDKTVAFTVSVEEAPEAADPVISSTRIEPRILVAANRPPMLWVDGGAIYGLVGTNVQRFAPSVENAMNIAIDAGNGKVYWTEKTGGSRGTINSANLDGTGVTELTAILSVPMGITVDVTGSKLYWTNARGRIQSANLDGSGIQNVLQELSGPTNIVVSNGFIYWTEGGNSIRRVSISGQKIVGDVAANLGTVGGLAVGGGKVYWTEMTAEGGGTINSANLDGTGATELASILATPMGIAVDTAGSNLYWTNARGRVQRANLNGSGIQNVVDGLGSPGEIVISNSISALAGTPLTPPVSYAKYDVNKDGAVDNTDAGLVIDALGTSNARYDVNGDGAVNFLDVVLVFDNRDDNVAGAPTIVGMKLSAAKIDVIEEQIDLLIATNDRSPAALRTLIYLQQLLVTETRPEKTQLFANYPNPFNPETWIPYELATDTHVKITIYNTQGVVIRTLQFGHQSAGYYTGRDRAAYWDGRNALGEQVASGLYFYQLETDEMSSMRKMVILK